MNRFIIVQTTLSSKTDAERIAKAVTSEKLAACAQIDGPVTSVYWWKDKLETEEEWRCSFKSPASLYPKIEQKLKAIHPYETPEIIAIPIEEGSSDYLNWLSRETSQP